MTILQTFFFLGKGGTGKSTASALLSLKLVASGKKVILASFDDAHNQSDIFQTRFSDKACTLRCGLKVVQIDRDNEIKRYLKKTIHKVKTSYAYLKAFNLDNYFDILKYSPGMEEYALVSAFMNLQANYRTHDYLIIDMPPTALSLRFFNLPVLSLAWINQLETLRREIYRRKQIVSRIKFAGKEFERDKVLSRIHEIKSDFETLRQTFETSSLFVVFNPDALSAAETRRIMDHLASLAIETRGLICNHRMPEKPEKPEKMGIRHEFSSIPFQKIPYSSVPLIGIFALEHHIFSFDLTFDEILKNSSRTPAAARQNQIR